MITKYDIIRLVEELEKFYVTEEEDYESFIKTLFHDDPNQRESDIMDNAYHLVTSQILLYFATIGIDVQEEIDKRNDLRFAQINRSLKNNYSFNTLVEKEFELGDSFEEEVRRRIEENMRKYREDQEDGGMA